MKSRAQLFSRIVAWPLGASLILWVIISNTLPFGATAHLTPGNGLSQLGPAKRVTRSADTVTQLSDIAYFNSLNQFQYEKAILKFKLKNTSPEQEVKVGFQDQEKWHYQSKSVSEPILDTLSWESVGDGPFLFQKTPTFKSVRDFLTNVPNDKQIGVYDYDAEALKQVVSIPEYKPATQDTTITAPLRGKITMYVYLQAEPFRMRLTKRDLNWYDDPDVVTAKVYKGSDQVFEATADDDGNYSNNRKLGGSQEINIKNPGPEVPESGVYKVVIDAPGDSVITRIQTNLHKIAFEGPLYVAGNKEIYGNIVKATAPTSLVTNALSVSLGNDHGQVQDIKVGDKTVKSAKAGESLTVEANGGVTPVSIPKNDVVINGIGYFSFSAEAFFAPTPYHIVPITGVGDLDRVDYILTGYQPPRKLESGWVQVERTFELNTAVAKKGKLSWVIAAPGLEANKRTIEIKDVEVTLSKKGWFK